MNKKYNKLKNNNLPTPFWNKKRKKYEYVYFKQTKDGDNEINIYDKLSDALGEITCSGMYYSYTTKYFTEREVDGKLEIQAEIGHDHTHSFEGVVEALYDMPESFSISEEEEELYSKQELEYLQRVQNYLLLIGMKDKESPEGDADRYRNKLHKKYANAYRYQSKEK